MNPCLAISPDAEPVEVDDPLVKEAEAIMRGLRVPFVFPPLMEPWQEKVYEALFDLPTHPDSIAFYLWERGIKGYVSRADACPLSRYVAARCGLHVSVGGTTIFLHRDGEIADTGIPTPPHCRAFISRFDHGHYPHLLDRQPPPRRRAWGPLVVTSEEKWYKVSF